MNTFLLVFKYIRNKSAECHSQITKIHSSFYAWNYVYFFVILWQGNNPRCDFFVIVWQGNNPRCRLGWPQTVSYKHAVMAQMLWSDHKPSIAYQYIHIQTHTCTQTLICLIRTLKSICGYERGMTHIVIIFQ